MGCFQHERKPNESIFDEYRESSNHELLLLQVKNCQGGRNFTHAVEWSYTVEGHSKKFVERNCELAIEKTEQLYKGSTPCLDDPNFKKNWNQWDNCLMCAHRLSWEVCIWHELVDLTLLGLTQTCKSSHKNGHELVTDAELSDGPYSSHK